VDQIDRRVRSEASRLLFGSCLRFGSDTGMVDQTKVTGSNGTSGSPTKAVAANSAEFFHDITTLAELQGKLFLADSQQSLHRSIVPLATLIIGLVLSLSTLPLALVAIALTLVETTSLSNAQAFWIAIGIGLVLGVLACVIAVWRLRTSFSVFQRSLNEWNLNIRWFRRVLKQLGKRSTIRNDNETPFQCSR